ncbi:MAG TPA: ABC transporter ATP-binding protein [Thermogutta sp.]|nr:ABC transporter ATP-binding protein [Thermogutta sp.]HQF14267.1 ABC transporter ATP-binding protein [Thermogutta sp.]
MNKLTSTTDGLSSASQETGHLPRSPNGEPSDAHPLVARPHFSLRKHDGSSETLRQSQDLECVDEPAEATECLLSVRGLVKSYRKANVEIPVLKGVDLDVRPGEFLAIVGQSGSGKSTLLHLIGLLDHPDQGAVFLGGDRIDNVPVRIRDQLRNRTFGMVFQFYHLLPELTTLENILVPVMIGRSFWSYWRQRKEYRRRAIELLELIGLGHRLKHRPHELSGGELQRAAIARALINRPQILLADEPTGNLDPETGAEILNLLRTLRDEEHLTIVMVTHDHSIAALADRIVCLSGGKIRNEAT